jgi:acyl-CoA thioesterase FadM
MQVQAKDVDMYGVVTNTMYHEYMYAARAALGASAGLSMEVLLGQYGIMLATTSYNITFKRYAGLCCACCPLVLGDPGCSC